MTVNRRKSPRGTTTLVALAVLVSAVTGCAGAAPSDELSCGIIAPGTAVFGDQVLVTRAATASDTCETLAPGTAQTLELRSLVGGVTAESFPVIVGDDGAFSARMRIPVGMAAGNAVVTAIPPADLACAGATANEECILPRVYLTVGFDSGDLAPLTITSLDPTTPTIPLEHDGSSSYAFAGPGPTEVTLVIWGSSCPARPNDFVVTSPNDTLAVVSTEVVTARESCNALAKPWTSVIEVPKEFAGYRTVTVDNVPAVLLSEWGLDRLDHRDGSVS